jgi:carbon-monoxide dehydrogenase medium subunit
MTAVHEPRTVDEAVRLLAGFGGDGEALAGGTWVMRAPQREEPRRSHYVSLRGLDELRGVRRSEREVRIGALVTHAELAAVETEAGALGALAEAARRSAFPAVRNVATLGGNLAAPFPEADLVPPLLAAAATIDLALPGGTENVPVETWLRGPRAAGALIAGVRVPVAPDRRAWFERLTVRHGAEYSVVSVAVSVDLDPDGVVAAARVAVGAVQEVPVRVEAAGAALVGRRPERAAGEEAGRAAAAALSGRDGLDAPGWYRIEVLPALVGRCVARLAPE